METELSNVSAPVESGDQQTDIAALPDGLNSTLATQQKPFSAGDYKGAVRGAFLAAYLLVRNERLAEAAVHDAIEALDPDGVISMLPRLAAEAGLKIRLGQPERLAAAPAWIGSELRAVLDLSQPLRDCFVMRILLGISRATCSFLTKTDGFIVDRYAGLAAMSLAERNMTVANEVAAR
jgi:hypothetical protein